MHALPDKDAFRKLCATHPGALIPVTCKFLADTLTPVEAFRRLKVEQHGFLLESVERGERIGRYSFVGTHPEVVFRGGVLPEPWYQLIRPEEGKTEPIQKADPVAALEKYLAEHPAIVPDPSLGLPPFAGGAVGYLGYDTARLFEPRLFKKPPVKRGFGELPDVNVPVYRTILVFDHVKNTIFVIHHADPREGGPEVAYAKAQDSIKRVVNQLAEPSAALISEIVPSGKDSAPGVSGNFTRDGFCAAVKKAQEYITAGDIIQVVLSQRFERTTTAQPFEVYRSLRAINPSPYLFYLKAPDFHVVGSSPEVMVRVENGKITVRPIAGTRRRGATPEEDTALALELLADEKERAEHIMLMDLGRNDVGKVSKFGSVQITEKMVIENYSHVMHIVSNVNGQLRPGLNSFDVLRSCHPAGTVSGAPKIRAMEIIDELEPDSRGPYAGAVGVMDYCGNLNTAIAIRTIIMRPKGNAFLAQVQSGAGIVADSVPESEFVETQSKARALFRAIDAAEARVE